MLPLKIVVPLTTLPELLSSAAILRTETHRISWRNIWRAMPFTVAGVLVGIYLFDALDARTLARWSPRARTIARS